ncbi:hypothetical protein B0H14DRAFT_2642660 [Mycena olivaceomarginata]|nr:hypothetical protein B0H14DRAFT_2642660 [Mycena olivaceomarginata]
MDHRLTTSAMNSGYFSAIFESSHNFDKCCLYVILPSKAKDQLKICAGSVQGQDFERFRNFPSAAPTPRKQFIHAPEVLNHGLQVFNPRPILTGNVNCARAADPPHAGTSTTYGESGDHSARTCELCGALQLQWGAGMQAGCRRGDVGASKRGAVRSVPSTYRGRGAACIRAHSRRMLSVGGEGVAGPRMHQWVKEGGASARQRRTGGCERGAHGGRVRTVGRRDVGQGCPWRGCPQSIVSGARSRVAAAVRHRRARAERIRAEDVCAGANEPGKASVGSGALQVTAGTLWGAVGTSTQWQRERDASEGALRHTWARYSGGGNRTSGTACEQGCMRRAEWIRPREACADSGKGGGREHSWHEGARGLEENCRPWKRCDKSCSNANGAKRAQQ